MSKTTRNFKKSIRIGILAVVLALSCLLCACSTDKTDSGVSVPAGMQVLREGDGYVCFVPTDWKLGQRFGVDYAYLDYYYCSISISESATELTNPADAFKADLDGFRASFADFELLSPEGGDTVTFGLDTSYQYAGVAYTYTMTVDGVANKYRQCLAIRDGKLYILTYTAAAEVAYDQYIDAFENVIADFFFTSDANGSNAEIALPPTDGIDIPDQMKLISNTTYVDYLFFVPESWKVTASDGLSSAHAGDPRVSVSASAHSPGTTSTIADYFDNYIETLSKNVSELQVIERYEVTSADDGEILRLDKAPAFRYTFTCKWMGVEYKFVQYVAISNSEMHYLTFSAPSADFDAHSAEFDSILKNFRFE